MAKKFIMGTICLIAFAVSATCGFAQENNPFRSKLPASTPGSAGATEETSSTAGYGDLLAEISKISLEGVIWSEKFAAAIINGQVYNKGDTIKEIDARIVDINKGKITIVYKGKTYILLKDTQ